MNKNLKNTLFLFRGLRIIFFGLGLMFLITLLYMWFSPYIFPFCAVMVVISFALIFSALAVFIRKQSDTLLLSNGWINNYKNLRSIFYFGIFIIIGNCIVIIGLLFYSEESMLGFILWRFFMLIFWICFFYFTYSIMKYNKNFETKAFPEWAYDGIEFIESLLIKNKLYFKKMGEKKFNIFIKFNEIFELKNNIFIRFRTTYNRDQKIDWLHPKSFISLAVTIGPIEESNKRKIKKLKTIIDELDDKYE